MTKKNFQKSMILATGLSFLSFATFADSSITELKNQAGKYPLEVGFFQNAFIQQELTAILPTQEQKLLKAFTVETPLTLSRSDTLLSTQICKPHDCGDNKATIYLDLAKKSLVVYVVTTEKNTTQAKWFTGKKSCNHSEKSAVNTIPQEDQAETMLKKINQCLENK